MGVAYFIFLVKYDLQNVAFIASQMFMLLASVEVFLPQGTVWMMIIHRRIVVLEGCSWSRDFC